MSSWSTRKLLRELCRWPFVYAKVVLIMDIQAHINEVWPKLHALAEPAFKEVKTAAFLADFLRKLGYDVTENVGNTTALTAVLDSGNPGPTVAVRTDMDCLLFKNEDGSLEPIHACGHDAHMTIDLGVAKLLQEQGLACGRVKILCQPAEGHWQCWRQVRLMMCSTLWAIM